MQFEEFLAQCQQRCQLTLAASFAQGESDHGHKPMAVQRLLEAMNYSTSDGGKRIRPVLVYAAANAITGGADDEALDSVAAAVEIIHCYSLVHDDLPAMDDDDLRRGRPSCHRAYDEATAILVGDALQARAFELLAELEALPAEQRLRLIKSLAVGAGSQGMVGGQAIDTYAVGKTLTLEQLRDMHSLKTGALIIAATEMGGIAAGASTEQLEALRAYARHIGLAFQVMDDVLDVTSETPALGKTGGKDAVANKPTYVSLMGLEAARSTAQQLMTEAVTAVEALGQEAQHLRGLAQFIINRKH